MARIRINKDRCKGCYLCIVNCPNSLIKIENELNVKGVRPAVFSGGKPARLMSKAGRSGGPARLMSKAGRSGGPARLMSKAGRSGGCTGCTMCALICPEFIIEVYK
jgi:NAD-dependent dihydropyrimidine dehydrogenase PreA subunit